MNLRRLVTIVFILASIAILLLLVRLPQVLERVAIFKLESLGATEINIELEHVGLARIKLGKLNFVLQQEAHRYTFASHDIDASFVLSDLLTGTLETVNVPEVTVFIEVLQNDKVSEPGRIPLPSEWLASIPFKNFNLESFQLELLNENKSKFQIKANGQLTLESATANARFDIQLNDYGIQRFELNLSPRGSSRLVISDIQSTLKPVQYIELSSGAWTSVDEQLQADVALNVDVKILQQQLHRWGLPVLPTISSSKLTMQGPLVVPLGMQASWHPKGVLALLVPKIESVGKQLSLNIPFELALDSEQMQVHVEKGSQVSLKKIRFADMQIESVLVRPLTPASCSYKFDKKNWSCDQFEMELNVPSIINKNNNITTSISKFEFTSLKGSSNTWSSNLNIDIPNWVINIGKGKAAQQVNLDRVHGSIVASKKKINANLALVAAGGGATLRVSATHDLKTQLGEAKYELEKVDLQQHSNVFSNTLNNWPPKLLLNTGTINLEGKASWHNLDAMPSQQTTLTMQNVGGMHGDLIFSGLNAVMDIHGDSPLRIKSRPGLSLARLDVGVLITDISLQAKMVFPKGDKPKFIVSDLVMNTLGGKVIGKQIEVDLARKQNPFTLQVSGIDMEELLKLEQNQGLLGTGIVDGELPMVMTRDGISMQNGYLGARKPGGKLRYSASEGIRSMAKTNTGIELLVTAMEDFTYKMLETVVDYTPDGLLKLKVRIEGSNPELEEGRPVHLNVNVENNILELLRSLRLASDISDNIAEQVRKRQLSK